MLTRESERGANPAPQTADASSFTEPPYFPSLRTEASSSSINPVLVFNDRKISYKRNATHVAIAYYIFYQQRYAQAQQSKDGTNRSPISLSLDPTHDARVLKSSAGVNHPTGIAAPRPPATASNSTQGNALLPTNTPQPSSTLPTLLPQIPKLSQVPSQGQNPNPMYFMSSMPGSSVNLSPAYNPGRGQVLSQAGPLVLLALSSFNSQRF